MRRRVPRALLCLVLAATATAAWSQAYPSRPMRLIVPFPPGGGSDVVGRLLGQKLTDSMGQQVVVDNRTGASGIIGTDLIAKAAPDGHTFGLVISSHLVNPSLFKQLPYDSVKDFAPITLIGHGLFVLVVHPSVPAKSLKELIAHAKANPGKLNAAVGSIGTIGHLATEQLKTLGGVDVVSVLYKGAGPAVIDTLAGQAHINFSSFPSVQSFIKAGRLRALCVLAAKRSPVAPDIPTAVESGLENMVLNDWWGAMAPARTDPKIVARLHAEIVKALALPDVKERLVGLGAEIVANTPQEFSAYIRSGIDKWGKVVRDAGIKPE